jgi:NAD(P)-dependent dehydrogenase (short-subunit alcohol dehydrogenase family)
VGDFTGDFTGRVIVVTGANSGIGLAAAEAFARGGAKVALVGRDRQRLDDALSRVRAAAPDNGGTTVAAYPCDFTELSEVRGLAGALRDAYPRIDVLANNAGGAFPNRVRTTDGHELTIQVNHLAPFLLSHLLRDRLTGGRIVNTASDAHTAGKLDPANLDSAGDGPFRMFTVYGSSKQANILFAAEAARRWPEIDSFSYHPGVVRTRFARDSRLVSTFYKVWPFLRTPAQGADTMLWLAGAPMADLVNGGYYVKRKLKEPSVPTRSPELAAELWTVSEQVL